MDNQFNIQFNERKAINSLLYILPRLGVKDFHKVFKILYFADRSLLTDYGKSITGDVYIAMHDGPVPSKIYDIIKSVRGDGYYKDNGKFSSLFEVHDSYYIRELVQSDLNCLSKLDIKYLDSSLELYGNKTFSELREISHDLAWNNATRDSSMNFEDILRENGVESEYIGLLKERASFAKMIEDATN